MLRMSRVVRLRRAVGLHVDADEARARVARLEAPHSASAPCRVQLRVHPRLVVRDEDHQVALRPRRFSSAAARCSWFRRRRSRPASARWSSRCRAGSTARAPRPLSNGSTSASRFLRTIAAATRAATSMQRTAVVAPSRARHRRAHRARHVRADVDLARDRGTFCVAISIASCSASRITRGTSPRGAVRHQQLVREHPGAANSPPRSRSRAAIFHQCRLFRRTRRGARTCSSSCASSATTRCARSRAHSVRPSASAVSIWNGTSGTSAASRPALNASNARTHLRQRAGVVRTADQVP